MSGEEKNIGPREGVFPSYKREERMQPIHAIVCSTVGALLLAVLTPW